MDRLYQRYKQTFKETDMPQSDAISLLLKMLSWISFSILLIAGIATLEQGLAPSFLATSVFALAFFLPIAGIINHLHAIRNKL